MISVTDQAKTFIVNMLTRQGKPAVELGLEPQGCNGYKYTWQPVDSINSGQLIALSQKHYVIVPEKYQQYLADSVIELENNRFGTRLSVINPNVEASCGCGESVNFKP
jgi:iron-sulfur cluster assembly protein